MLFYTVCVFHISILAFYVFECVYICLSAYVMRAIDMHLIEVNLLAYLLMYLSFLSDMYN